MAHDCVGECGVLVAEEVFGSLIFSTIDSAFFGKKNGLEHHTPSRPFL